VPSDLDAHAGRARRRRAPIAAADPGTPRGPAPRRRAVSAGMVRARLEDPRRLEVAARGVLDLAGHRLAVDGFELEPDHEVAGRLVDPGVGLEAGDEAAAAGRVDLALQEVRALRHARVRRHRTEVVARGRGAV